jgi:hypothetical protein
MTTGRSALRARRWSELSPPARAATAAAAAVQLGLLAAALSDLHKRDREQVNGPRWVWVATCFINFVGPLAYFAYGRRDRVVAR